VNAAVTDAILRADWPAPRGVHAFTTLRHGAGVSSTPFDSFNMGLRCGDDANAVVANRQALVDGTSLPSEPRWLRQVHETTVARFDAPDRITSRRHPAFASEAVESEADASVTCARDTVLAILTADCLPIVFAAEDGSEVAVAHAGWRGLAAGVVGATVGAMRTSSERIISWLGPAAGPAAYEVGEDVFGAFVTRDARSETAFVATRSSHWLVDLYALARMDLADVGVTRTFGGDLCTITDSHRFYSHRRDRCTGRMATVIWRA